MLKEHEGNACNATTNPMATRVDIRPTLEDEVAPGRVDHLLHRNPVGELFYFGTCICPDFCFAICALARILHKPAIRHQTLLFRVLRYIAGTKFEMTVSAYSDADRAGCNKTKQFFA